MIEQPQELLPTHAGPARSFQSDIAPGRLLPPTVSAAATSSRRWPVAFQWRFFLALLLGLVWIGPAWRDQRALYALLLWDCVALLVWLVDLARLPKPREIVASRRWLEPLSLDIDSRVELRVANIGTREVEIVVEDDVPTAMCPTLPKFTLTIPPQGSAVAAYSVHPTQRGNMLMGRIFLRYHGPARFAERWAAVDARQTLRIYPNLREPQRYTLYLTRSRQMEQEKRLKRLVGRGREFESLREFREADETRDICWTATARRGKLISKVYQTERSQSVVLVVDAGRLMLARTRSQESGVRSQDSGFRSHESDLTTSQSAHLPTCPPSHLPTAPPLMKLDYAVNAALTLAHVAQHSGDTTGLLTYGRKLQSYLPCARGTEHLRHILEQLALVSGEAVEADHALAADSLLARHRRRSLVVWLTDLAETAATPDVIEAASRLLSRHLVLFAVVGEPELRALVARRPESPAQMYQYVAAQQVIQRRELLLRRMREHGALAMEFLPGRLSPEIVNHYLQIKWKGLL
jgi:uncharacterized protein (DUF58 family)